MKFCLGEAIKEIGAGLHFLHPRAQRPIRSSYFQAGTMIIINTRILTITTHISTIVLCITTIVTVIAIIIVFAMTTTVSALTRTDPACTQPHANVGSSCVHVRTLRMQIVFIPP